jgi:glucuronosyltransferase
VSFGSSAGDFTDEIFKELFEGLGRMKQTVVMRYVGDIEEAKKKAPANLHLLSWMPQFDMLAHKNTVAFVTHCGNNGQYEGLYNGVPMLGVPLFAEQHHNSFRGVSHGYGLKIDDISRMTADDLAAALTELIENPTYREKVQHASAIMKSDPMLPKEKMAYWVDHVMQHGGAHLRPSAMDMSFASLFLLDVLAFFTVVSILFVISFYLFIRYCCCDCRDKKCKCRPCACCCACCKREDKAKKE